MSNSRNDLEKRLTSWDRNRVKVGSFNSRPLTTEEWKLLHPPRDEYENAQTIQAREERVKKAREFSKEFAKEKEGIDQRKAAAIATQQILEDNVKYWIENSFKFTKNELNQGDHERMTLLSQDEDVQNAVRQQLSVEKADKNAAGICIGIFCFMALGGVWVATKALGIAGGKTKRNKSKRNKTKKSKYSK